MPKNLLQLAACKYLYLVRENEDNVAAHKECFWAVQIGWFRAVRIQADATVKFSGFLGRSRESDRAGPGGTSLPTSSFLGQSPDCRRWTKSGAADAAREIIRD